MAKLLVKLGPKAGGQFWDPYTATKVSPREVVEITKMSWLIDGAIKGGHLVIVTEDELQKTTTSGTSDKPVTKMNKEELVAYVADRLVGPEKAKFEGLTKKKMLGVIDRLEELDDTLVKASNLSDTELAKLVKDTFDEDDMADFENAKDKVKFFKEIYVEYFDPFE